jgi:hypothetical protein
MATTRVFQATCVSFVTLSIALVTFGACSSSSDGVPATPMDGGASGASGAGGTANGGAAGAGGTGAPVDGGATCSGENPAGSASCGVGKSCHLTSCGPPTQYTCVPAGTAAAGGTCASSGDCASGLTCVGYSATLRACEKQCTTDADCPNAHCAQYSTCSGMLGGGFCTRSCTDVTAAGAAACGTGFKCDGGCFGQVSSTFCIAAGTARSGACQSSTQCAAGYTCISTSADAGTMGTCTQLCQTNADCMSGMCTGNIGCGSAASGLHFCI